MPKATAAIATFLLVAMLAATIACTNEEHTAGPPTTNLAPAATQAASTPGPTPRLTEATPSPEPTPPAHTQPPPSPLPAAQAVVPQREHPVRPAPTSTPRPARPRATPLPPPSKPVSRPATPPPTKEPAPTTPATEFLATTPSIMEPGSTAAITVNLFHDGQPAAAPIAITLKRADETIASTTETVRGSADILLPIPRTPNGQYYLKLEGPGFSEENLVQVADRSIVLLQTDKAIYKPGQEIKIRALTMDSHLRPKSRDITIDATDDYGHIVFQTTTTTDEYGMAPITIPISEEPVLGQWTLGAQSGANYDSLGIQVDHYTPPRFDVQVQAATPTGQNESPISGSVSAVHTYGKPVKGQLDVTAFIMKSYTGETSLGTISIPFNGTATFELPHDPELVEHIIKYNPAVYLSVTVTETETGHSETIDHTVTRQHEDFDISIHTPGQIFKPGMDFPLLVTTKDQQGNPVDKPITLLTLYLPGPGGKPLVDKQETGTRDGVIRTTLTPPRDTVAILTAAGTPPLEDQYDIKELVAAHSPSGSFIQLVRAPGEPPHKPGDTVEFLLDSTTEPQRTLYTVISRNTVTLSGHTDSQTVSFKATPVMAPASTLAVYQILQSGEVTVDYATFNVENAYPMTMQMDFDQEQTTPGGPATIRVNTPGKARVALTAVDRALTLLENEQHKPGQVFHKLAAILDSTKRDVFDEQATYDALWTVGATETMKHSGLTVLTNLNLPEGEEALPVDHEYSEEDNEILKDATNFLFRIEPAGGGSTDSAYRGQAEATKQRLRQFFPETWLWTTVDTADNGTATLEATAPDSITTWDLRATALSKEHGLAVSQTPITVFQPVFVDLDMPEIAVRHETINVRATLYNYSTAAQTAVMEIQRDPDRMTIQGPHQHNVVVPPNDAESVDFSIRLDTEPAKSRSKSPPAARNRTQSGRP